MLTSRDLGYLVPPYTSLISETIQITDMTLKSKVGGTYTHAYEVNVWYGISE